MRLKAEKGEPKYNYITVETESDRRSIVKSFFHVNFGNCP